jgi:hypothetical protein
MARDVIALTPAFALDRAPSSAAASVGGASFPSIILKSEVALLFAPERQWEIKMLGVMVRDLQRLEERRLRNVAPLRGVLRQSPLSVVVAGLALLGAGRVVVTAAHAEGGSPATQLTTVSVPAGPLDKGLITLGQQTELKLVYPSTLTAGKRTVGVAGRMTAKDAVKRLLADTGLGFTMTRRPPRRSLPCRRATRRFAPRPLSLSIRSMSRAGTRKARIPLAMGRETGIARATRSRLFQAAKRVRSSRIFRGVCKRSHMNFSTSRVTTCFAKVSTTRAA